MKRFFKIILFLTIGIIIFLIGLGNYETRNEKYRKELCSCDEEVKSNPIKYQGIEIADSYGRGFLVGKTLKLYNDSSFHYMTWGDIHPTIGRTGKFKIIENEIQFLVNCYYENYGWPKEPYGWEILEIEDERRKMSNRSICINNGEVYFGCRNPIENKDDNEYFEKNEDYFLTIYKPKKEK